MRGTDNSIDKSIIYASSRQIFLLFLFIMLSFSLAVYPACAGDVRVGQSTFSTISEALDSAADGATIVVFGGEYRENLIINKPVQLLGADPGTGKPVITTISGEAGIRVDSNGVSIEGFTITGDSECAVLINSDNNILSDNDILKTPVGITVFSSAGTTISGNNIKGHRIGLFIDDSADCAVYLNNFENTINAKSLSKPVRWSTSSMIYIYSGQNFTSELGNYWNDYYGQDENKNGIGDQPYSPYETAGLINTQNQMFLNSINLQNLATGGSSYWQNLFYTSNYVLDDSPLIDYSINYNILAPAGTQTGSQGPDETKSGNNSLNRILPGQKPLQKADWWDVGSPFEIVFLMLLISGVSAGLIAFSGDFGSLNSERRPKKLEILFFSGGYFALATALLYSSISYASRLVYNNVDYGFVQIGFILMTAYLIASSGILGVGIIRSKIPLPLYRIHPQFAAASTAAFIIAIITAPLDLGPITSVSYPAALVLSVLLPVVFSRLFNESESTWGEKIFSAHNFTIIGHDHDSTFMYPDEKQVLSSGMSGSYFPAPLNERYMDVEFIGKGGIARVFKAKRRLDGEVVAVKVPINFDEATGRLFMKEMRIWEDLKHPNIVSLYSVNILPVPFVEMEYVSRALSDLDLPLTQKEAFKIICGIANGLLYAHSRHIIHRDIKPQNILITDDNNPKITDWGLGKIIGDGNETTTIGFSLNYAAPEQIAPKKYGKPDVRTDIYQMGILFYEILVGQKPFSGLGVAEMSDEILYRTPLMPSENREENIIFDEIITKMLSKNPDDRYSSINELISALKNIKPLIFDEST